MPRIAKFVNAKDIQRLFEENGTKIGYNVATRIKKNLVNSHPNTILPNKHVIPVTWVYEVYGIGSYK